MPSPGKVRPNTISVRTALADPVSWQPERGGAVKLEEMFALLRGLAWRYGFVRSCWRRA